MILTVVAQFELEKKLFITKLIYSNFIKNIYIQSLKLDLKSLNQIYFKIFFNILNRKYKNISIKIIKLIYIKKNQPNIFFIKL